jgi:8-oxo-dGTP diphosphatase
MGSLQSILAAGGIVLGAGDNVGRIALVKRRRYPGEIGLPKGKTKEGEEIVDTALREVREETGCKVRIREYAGSTHYFVGAVPKAVFYFVMEPDGSEEPAKVDAEEIEAVEWAPPEKAIAKLTHRADRDLISAVFGIRRGKSK